MAQEELKQVYHHIGRLIHAPLPLQEIALVESATVAWTRLFYSMVTYQDQHLKISRDQKKIILVSQVEYAANVVACCHWIQQPGTGKQHEWTTLCIPSKIDNNNNQNMGVVDVTVLEEMLQGNYLLPDGSKLDPSCIALVCITHIFPPILVSSIQSMPLGTRLPVTTTIINKNDNQHHLLPVLLLVFHKSCFW
jgi:hypothetical protein